MEIDDIGVEYMRGKIFDCISNIPGMAKIPDHTWSAYIFNRRYSDHRHQWTLFRSQRHSLLSALFEVLTEEERGRILLGAFDIGNGRRLPNEFQTYAALEREIGHRSSADDSALKSTKLLIKEILDIPVRSYYEVDRTITLKVIKLLYRYQVGLNSSLCSPKLCSFLKMPGRKRPSFEFNDAHAIKEAAEKQRIIDELTVHLGTELGAECRGRIRSTFMALTHDVGVSEDFIREKVRVLSSGNIALSNRACEMAKEGLDHLRTTYGTGRLAQRLDLDLLIYLRRAQVENRNKAHSEVVDALTKADLPVRSIEADIIRFNSKFDQIKQGRAVNVTVCHLPDILSFLNRWSNELRILMQSALGSSVTLAHYKSCAETVRKIIKIDGAAMVYIYEFSALDVISLLCMAYIAEKQPAHFSYKPYWHGQKNQSDRPFYQLNQPQELTSEEIPEGRVVYWRECTKLIKYTLLDQKAYWEMDIAIRTHINNAVSQVMATHDINVMQKFAVELFDFAKNMR
ncbi:hypothetical protein [Azospirillum sp. Marseille-Q6669]